MSASKLTSAGRNGYIQIDRLEDDEIITPNCYHSMNDGRTLVPIANIGTIGQKPSDFSKDRSFWKIIFINTDYFCLEIV